MSAMTAAFDDCVSRVYRAGSGVGTWQSALRRLAELTGSRNAQIYAASLRTTPASLLFAQDDGELDHGELARYGEFMQEQGDPRTEHAVRLYRAGRVEFYRDQDLFDERDMGRHPYYAEVLAPMGLKYGAVQLLPRRGDVAVGVTLQRTPRQGPAGVTAEQLLGRIAYHIDQALRIEQTLSRVARRGRATYAAPIDFPEAGGQFSDPGPGVVSPAIERVRDG